MMGPAFHRRVRWTSEFLEVDGVLATRSNWLSSDPTITTPIVFVGVHHSDGASTEFTALMARRLPRLPTAASIPNGYPSWLPDGSAVTVEGAWACQALLLPC